MLDRKFPVPGMPAPSASLRRGLVWIVVIMALILGVIAVSPPTRTDAMPWTGTMGA
jgi:hypothetical protein